jgi:hypothetical protein
MASAGVFASSVEKVQLAAQEAANSSSRSAVAFSDQAQQILLPRVAG